MKHNTVNWFLVIILAIGLLCMLIGLGSITGKLNILPETNELLGFNSAAIGPWSIQKYGTGSEATLTTGSESGDYYSRLICTSFNTPSGGWIAQVYWINSGSMSYGQSYTLDFYYRSAANVVARYMSEDASYNTVDNIIINCPATSTWTFKTVTFTAQSATYPRIAFNIYGVGELNVDDVNFGLTVTAPTPSPVPTASPSPSPSPTATPIPTPTPFGATPTPIPSVTPTPSPTPIGATPTPTPIGATPTPIVTQKTIIGLNPFAFLIFGVGLTVVSGSGLLFNNIGKKRKR
jgi:hypothetical protein